MSNNPQFNLMQLCVIYTIHNHASNDTKVISIVEDRILQEVLALHRNTHNNTTDLSALTGFVKSPYHITRYSATLKEFSLEKAVQQAIREDNVIVITEMLPTKANDLLNDMKNKKKNKE